MSDIKELEGRITAALERIARGAQGLIDARQTDDAPQPVANEAELQALRDALDAERSANAQLEERVKAIRDKQDSHISVLEARVAKLTARAQVADEEISRLRRVNAQLRANNKALRDANAEGLGDAHLINKSMMAELDALRSLREGDRNELDEIIGELAPLIEETANA